MSAPKLRLKTKRCDTDYRPQSRSLVGDLTTSGLRSIFSSFTVLGINGVSIKKGCTTAVHQETSVNQAMIENSSGKVIVVADHSKMNCVSSFLTCPLSRIDMIVTPCRPRSGPARCQHSGIHQGVQRAHQE